LNIFRHCVSLANQLKVGSKAAKKNKKRNSKKLTHQDEARERETVDFNHMLTELKKQLEEAKSTKVCKYKVCCKLPCCNCHKNVCNTYL